jgi:hypothetical protein
MKIKFFRRMPVTPFLTTKGIKKFGIFEIQPTLENIRR